MLPTMVPCFRLTHVLFLFFLNVSHLIVADELDGVCDITPMNNKTRYVLDKANNRWIPMTYQVAIGPSKSACCEGYRNASDDAPLRCEPVCDPPCVKATCDSPNTCVCLDGHEMSNGSNSTCVNVCDACVNGRCYAGGTECVCDSGYEKTGSQPHVCHPTCSPPCENGVCKRPGRCDCHAGYRKRQREGVISDNVCVPQCGAVDCLHGTCVAPDVCSCKPGYELDEDSPYVCKPVCEPNCTHGFCASPDVCGCDEGMEIHRSNRTLCVPMLSENFRGSCEVNASEAIAYDPATKCFTVLRDLATWSSDSYCAPVEGLLNYCSKPPNNTVGNDSTLNCTLAFRCNASQQPDGVRLKIECFYETGDFQVELEYGVLIGSQRRDVGINLNAFKKQNRSNDNGEERISVWTLHPPLNSPICGQMHFGVQLSSTMMNFKTSPPGQNRNTILCLSVLFVIMTVLGGYLWFRKRTGVNLQNDNSNSFDNPMYVDRGMLNDTDAGGANTNFRPIMFTSPFQNTKTENGNETDEGETAEAQYESIDEIGLVS